MLCTNSHTFMQANPTATFPSLQAKCKEYPIIWFLTVDESFRACGIKNTTLYQRCLSPLQCFWLIGRTQFRGIQSSNGQSWINLPTKFLNHDQLVTGFCTEAWGCTTLQHFSFSLMRCWVFLLFIFKSHLVKDPMINKLQYHPLTMISPG